MLADYEMGELLVNSHTIAVVGLSNRSDRASYAVASYLKRSGYHIIPVNPYLSGCVLGERPYASLRDIREHVDIVNVFRRSEFLPGVIEDAAAIGADVVWSQLGVMHFQAQSLAHHNGVGLVLDRCIAVEHRRLSRYAEVFA